MIVRLLKPWNGFRIGYEFTAMPKSSAMLLVGRGLAEIEDETDKDNQPDNPAPKPKQPKRSSKNRKR